MVKKKRKVSAISRHKIKPPVSPVEKKLDLILKRLDSVEKKQNIMIKKEDDLKVEEDKIFSEEESFSRIGKQELYEEKKIESEEKEELDELKKIESLEESIKDNLKESPLKRITYRDVTKGILGAFFGIVGHFAFVEGTHLSEDFSFLRSTLLLVSAFVIILLFLYFSGFRKVNDKFIFEFLPIRAVVIFFSAILTIVVVLLLYGFINAESHFEHIYNSVAAISILAVLGAGTADLIGRNE
ncbi:MAG: hypothetical protein ACP5N3_02385 [Candidatus Nanoarchaeia archaeon]